MDINDRVQLRRQPDDRVVIRMTAHDAARVAAVVLDANARPAGDPFVHLAAAFDGLRGIDGN